MSIITKAGAPVKGSPTEFTLNKSDLALIPSVAGDVYFSDLTNWKNVIVYYGSSVGNQKQILNFNAAGSSPSFDFSVSSRARDVFEVQKIIIQDFDGGCIIVPRSELNTSEFDVDMSAVPAYDYINWDLTNGPTTNAVGAVLTNPSSQNWFYMMKSSTGYSGDFEVNYSFEGADCLEIGVGMADNTTLGVFTGSVAVINRSGTYFEINTNGDTWLPGQYSFNAAGTNTIKFSRIGSTVTVYLNGISVYNYSSSATLYPLGRPYLGNITSSYYAEPSLNLFSNSLKDSAITISNNGLTIERTAFEIYDYVCALLNTPYNLSSNEKIYFEMTVNTSSSSNIQAFGAVFQTGIPTTFAGGSNTLPAFYGSVGPRIFTQNGKIWKQSENAPFVELQASMGVLAPTEVWGLAIDIGAKTFFFVKNGVPTSVFSFADIIGSADRLYIAVGPHSVGDKYTKNIASSNIPTGYTLV